MSETIPALTDRLTVDFAGELFDRASSEELTVGRSGDLAIEDNPYLHREFLRFGSRESLWWVHNVGSRLAAYLTDERGLMRSTLAPGAQLPLVFPTTLVTFAAGETLYELIVSVTTPHYEPQAVRGETTGRTTITPGRFTLSQTLALLALAEPVLRRSGSGAGGIPSTQQAAGRLGWTTKRFDKKVENICDKLTAAGIRGLRGTGRVASNRRLQLVEYAVSTLLVTADDLHLLDAPHGTIHDEGGDQ
jgi:hypothetical protein